jgi:hypothetical protein
MSSRDEPEPAGEVHGRDPLRPGGTSERRCPTCGALVTPDAEWCGQCFTNLVEAPAGSGEVPPEPGSTPGPGPTDVAAAPETSRTPHWTCPTCGEDNGLDVDPCPSCGTPFARLFEDPRGAPDVARGRAIGWSLAYPGLGHRLVGRTGEGVARGAVFTLALGAILFLVVSRAGNSLAPILAFLAVYALIGIAVYAFTALEAGHLADGGDPLVSPRAFAWVAAGLVLVSLGVSLFIAVGAIRGG